MKMMRYWASAGLLVFAATAARAGDEVLATGDPPLTRAVADRKIDYWEWVFELRIDDRQRAELRRLQTEEWGRRDKEWKERWVTFLAVWQNALAADGANSTRLRAGARETALDALARGEADAVGRSLVARQPAPDAATLGALAQRDAENARRMAALRLQFEQRQQFLRDLSNAQAQHHETMMLIIRNIRPSGRYEYNPSTGRYDRYVPNP